MRACLIDAAGLVVNAIICGGEYTPPAGLTLVESDDGNIGDSYAGGVFTPAEQVEPEPSTKTPALWAVAYGLQVVDGEIIGLGSTSRIGGGIYLDVGVYMILLDGTLTAAQYFPKVFDDGARLRVSEKGDDYFIVTAFNASNVAFDPEEFSIEIVKLG